MRKQEPESLPQAIFLMGPTASGKTAVAVELAQSMPVEIISVDSALVYRDMNIGTAKPDAATLARAPHHLIDILDPTEAYSAAAFCHDALHLMHDITQRGKVPMLVGGTMLYFKALREGLSELPRADAEVRAVLDAEIAQYGIKHLHRELEQVDAETAARLKPNDTQRIQRALEVFRITGKPMSTMIKNKVISTLPYRILPVALIPDNRSELHQRISMRFKSMIEQGLVDELRWLRQHYHLHPNLPSMRCVGYRQAWKLLEGELSEAQLLETGIASTRQLAKRQLTWLRSMPDSVEIDCLSSDLLQQIKAVIAD
jgi:tRNA dimethylallyltransferase